MQASQCDCRCPESEVVEIPGVEGAAGTNGTDGAAGVSAYTFTTADFVVPAIAGTVAVTVANTSWMVEGQQIFIEGAGAFGVTTINSSTNVLLTYLDYTGNTHATDNIASGAGVTPTGTQAPLAGALPTAFTDNSGGTPSNTINAGVGVSTLTIPLTSLATGLSTGAIDLLTNYIPGYRFKILKFDFVTTIVGAGAAATQGFNLEINSTNVSSLLTVTLSSTDTIGKVTAGVPDPIVANNNGNATDTLSIEMAAGGTVFTSGSGYFIIKIQNLDTVDAIASLAEHIGTVGSVANNLIDALT